MVSMQKKVVCIPLVFASLSCLHEVSKIASTHAKARRREVHADAGMRNASAHERVCHRELHASACMRKAGTDARAHNRDVHASDRDVHTSAGMREASTLNVRQRHNERSCDGHKADAVAEDRSHPAFVCQLEEFVCQPGFVFHPELDSVHELERSNMSKANQAVLPARLGPLPARLGLFPPEVALTVNVAMERERERSPRRATICFDPNDEITEIRVTFRRSRTVATWAAATGHGGPWLVYGRSSATNPDSLPVSDQQLRPQATDASDMSSLPGLPAAAPSGDPVETVVSSHVTSPDLGFLANVQHS